MKVIHIMRVLGIVMITSLAIWQIYGEDGARNLFVFIAWGFAILLLIAALSSKTKHKQKIGLFWKWYSRLQALTVIVSTAWLGMPLLATTWALSLLVLSAKNEYTEENEG